jgi:hypothetical protein
MTIKPPKFCPRCKQEAPSFSYDLNFDDPEQDEEIIWACAGCLEKIFEADMKEFHSTPETEDATG